MTKEINEGELSAAELAKVSGGEGILLQMHCYGPELKNDSPCISHGRGRCAECGDCPRNHD